MGTDRIRDAPKYLLIVELAIPTFNWPILLPNISCAPLLQEEDMSLMQAQLMVFPSRTE
jgi:hypothetical protein